MTHLVQVILEAETGREVTLQVADVAPVYASIAQGDRDVFLDAWVPTTHKDYTDRFGDRMVDLGPNFHEARIGLVVPRYVDVNTIPELKTNASLFDGKIVGVDYGAGIMKKTEEVMEAYGLNEELALLSSSGPAMTARLKKAISNQAPIVVTGWMPHWIFNRFELKFLEDPRSLYGSGEKIHTMVRQGFPEEEPKVSAFLERFQMTPAQLLGLMDRIARSDAGPDEVARKWYEEHPQVVQQWVSPEDAPKEADSTAS